MSEANGSAPVVAMVAGASAAQREIASALLADAGFAAVPIAVAPELLVLISLGNDASRGREIRAAGAAIPDVPLLAVLPGGTPRASLRRALLAGAGGIVLEPELGRALVPTARAMLAGQLTVPGDLGRVIAPRPLSHREKEILRLVVDGSTNREIAHKLFLAESTVKTHLSSAFRKIDARSRAEAVARIQDPEAGVGLGVLELAGVAVT